MMFSALEMIRSAICSVTASLQKIFVCLKEYTLLQQLIEIHLRGMKVRTRSHVHEIHSWIGGENDTTNLNINILANQGLGDARGKKFLRVPFRTFYITQCFFSRDLFRFWSLGYPGVRDQVGGVILVLRTFPELVWRSVQNLVSIGTVFVCERGTQVYIGVNTHQIVRIFI